MPRGGKRPGAGRPANPETRLKRAKERIEIEKRKALREKERLLKQGLYEEPNYLKERSDGKTFVVMSEGQKKLAELGCDPIVWYVELLRDLDADIARCKAVSAKTMLMECRRKIIADLNQYRYAKLTQDVKQKVEVKRAEPLTIALTDNTDSFKLDDMNHQNSAAFIPEMIKKSSGS